MFDTIFCGSLFCGLDYFSASNRVVRKSRVTMPKKKLSDKSKRMATKRWKKDIVGLGEDVFPVIADSDLERPRPIVNNSILTNEVARPTPTPAAFVLDPALDQNPELISRPSTSSDDINVTTPCATLSKFSMICSPRPSPTPDINKGSTPKSRIQEQESGTEFFFIQRNSLYNLIKEFPCKGCCHMTLGVEVEERAGMSCKFKVVCTNCKLLQSESYSSARNLGSEVPNTPRSSRPGFLVNSLFAKAFLNFGKGHAAMERFSMEMNMAVPSSSSYYETVKTIHKETITSANISLQTARAEVRKAYVDADISLVGQDIIDVVVTYDGSWHKRGHTSTYGIACVIDILTGLVIDFHVLSKYCHSCSINSKRYGCNSDEFNTWYETHKDDCDKNYTGSSGAMEKDIAEILWRRSEKVCKMRYTTMLSDGDAKTIQHLNTLQVYGDKLIEKEECLNHVAKRLGTGLRNQVKEWKGKGITLGGKKQGSLTEEKIVKLQNYYRCAIKKNVPDVKKMKTAIFATLLHEMSTDSEPRHEKCPDGKDSWCFYQRSVANEEAIPSHNQHLGTALSMEVIKKIMPVYQRLASDELLKRCLRGKTQNTNESLHSVIWRKCGKDIFVGKAKVCSAVAAGVLEFNQGCMETARVKWLLFGVSPGVNTSDICKKRDTRRIKQSTRQLNNSFKNARKQKKWTKSKIQKKATQTEGSTYGAGQF